MPKERVEDSGYRMFDAVVGWSKESEYVQLGVVNAFPDKKTVLVDGEEVEGLYLTLSPETIEMLIKALRKAKRQSFPK